MSSVFANGRSIAHKGDGLVQTCPTPDVCKTPSPGGPVPVPYVNVARDGDLSGGSSSVLIEGNPVALADSNLSTSSGDEAGTAGGGIVSSKIKGKLTWSGSSTDVKFEDKGVIRFLDICLHNGNTSNDGGQPHTGSPNAYGGDAPCPLCGAQGGHPIPSGKESQRAAKEVADNAPPYRRTEDGKEGYMIGVLHCRTPDGKFVTLRMASGPTAPAGFRSFPKDVPNVKGEIHTKNGKKIDTEQHGLHPRTCAAPKLLEAAQRLGFTPLQMTEIWKGPRMNDRRDGKHQASCNACKELLPAMLCDKA